MMCSDMFPQCSFFLSCDIKDPRLRRGSSRVVCYNKLLTSSRVSSWGCDVLLFLPINNHVFFHFYTRNPKSVILSLHCYVCLWFGSSDLLRTTDIFYSGCWYLSSILIISPYPSWYNIHPMKGNTSPPDVLSTIFFHKLAIFVRRI